MIDKEGGNEGGRQAEKGTESSSIYWFTSQMTGAGPGQWQELGDAYRCVLQGEWRTKHPGHPLLFPGHQQRAGSEVETPRMQICIHMGCRYASGSFIHYAIVLTLSFEGPKNDNIYLPGALGEVS